MTLRKQDPAAYPVRGVDVSSHNGEIDWPVLAAQDISFVYMKATEGSDFVDRRFAANFAGAQRTALRVGAYHFFSYTSAGRTQAENFIRTVAKTGGMLPPMVDVELPAARRKQPPEAAAVRKELDDLIARLTAHYGMPPVLYASDAAYRLYRLGEYAGCDIWMRSISRAPRLPDGRSWTFWQYADKATLAGYSGGVAHIDLNVFRGSRAEFAAYAAAERCGSLAR